MARARFQALKQHNTPFREFYAEFDHLANLCGYVDQAKLVEDLNYKLNKRLQAYLFQLPGSFRSFPTLIAAKEAIQARDDQEQANAFVDAASTDPSNAGKDRSAKGYIIPARRRKEAQTLEQPAQTSGTTSKEYLVGDRKPKPFVPGKRPDKPAQIAELDLEASQEDSSSGSSSDSENE